MKKYIACLILACLFPLKTFAWNALGHMVIANIAYQNLKPEVKQKVDNLVTYMHQQYADMGTFINISYWPDAIRSQKVETYTHWHYIDVAFSNDGTSVKNLIDTDNAVWAVNQTVKAVKYTRGNPYERIRFLSFLTHIVSDLHQPLHTVSYVSATFPHGDRGGNNYFILNNNKRMNLHKLWDQGVNVFVGDTSQDRVKEITNSIMSHYPESYFGSQVNNLNADDWAKEGMNNAKKYVYTTPQNQKLSDEYIEKGKSISEQQAALAGYRLAKLLNELLKSKVD
jgi:hypothetical protein